MTLLNRLSLNPTNLTTTENWEFLQLTDLTLFEANYKRGIEKWRKCTSRAETRGSRIITGSSRDLVIKPATNNDMVYIKEMIRELAIYEDMLDRVVKPPDTARLTFLTYL